MITIYHLGLSQSERIVWLMEELGLPYRLEWFDRDQDMAAPLEYVALHPAAMAPVIKDGDLILADSTAIVQYIAHKHGGGRFTVAPSAENYADYIYWLQFNSNQQSAYMIKAALDAVGADKDRGVLGKIAQRRGEGLFRQMDEHLANHTYLAGEEFTLADFMASFGVITMPNVGMGFSIANYPHIQRYADQLAARPAWQKAMSIAGPQAKKPT